MSHFPENMEIMEHVIKTCKMVYAHIIVQTKYYRSCTYIGCFSQRFFLVQNAVCCMQCSLEKTQVPKCDQDNHNHSGAVYCYNTALLWQETLGQCKIRWGKGALDIQTFVQELYYSCIVQINICK